MKNKRIAAILVAFGLLLTACGGEKTEGTAGKAENIKESFQENPASPEELFAEAVRDAVFAEEDEIQPLVTLTKEDPLTTWDDQERVLLVTWHNYPDSYPEGETVSLEWGTVWAFTDKEIAEKYETEVAKAEDAELRLNQLIGFSPESEHSTFTGFWVSPQDVLRPAYQTDPADGSMTTAPAEDMPEEFREWFDENILNSYFYGELPWTRLGYTYDWADNGTEYGMTEFLVSQGAQVEVAFTETTEEFLDRMAKEAA